MAKEQPQQEETKEDVTLDEQHLYNGVVYGPGTVNVPESVAKVLRASHERVLKHRGRGPTLKVNGIMTGILPGTEANHGIHGANTISPEDVAKQREASEAAAAKTAENA